MFTFFSLAKTKKEKKVNRQTKSATTATTTAAKKETKANKHTKKQTRKKIPLRGFSLRRYAVTLFTNNPKKEHSVTK